MTDPTPPPPPLPPAPPPLPAGGYVPVWKDQRAVDAGHLRLLSIFHYAYAGMGLLGIGFLVAHYMLMRVMFSNPAMWQQNGQSAPPPEFFAIFKWFYLFGGLMIVFFMVLSVVSGRCIARRKARMFTLIVAGLNCLQFPFGTALGVFTLIVLQRPSVQRAYEESPPTATLPAPVV